MASCTLTSEQHQVLNAWARYGAGHFVCKLGRGWVVKVAGYQTPHVFPRKHLALTHAEERVKAFLNREAEVACA